MNILSLDQLSRLNKTKVVFAVDPEYSETSSASISLIRSLFTSLVIHQTDLQLTSFGDPSFFEVLKFKGGITIIPQQNAFPLQKVQTKFNFSLNFPIYQIQRNFDELTNQLKSGLHLTSNEVCRTSFFSYCFYGMFLIVIIFSFVLCFLFIWVQLSILILCYCLCLTIIDHFTPNKKNT